MKDCEHPASDMSGFPAPIAWRQADLARLATATPDIAPVIAARDIVAVGDSIDIWDAWPIQTRAGDPADLGDGLSLWLALAAPRFPDPDTRHGHARIHLIARRGDAWIDQGPALPDGFSPGSREWSGSAVLDPDGITVTLYFTAAGHRGEAEPGFLQRLFAATASLVRAGGGARLADWRDLRSIVDPDPAWYMPSDHGDAAPGAIKAFRDPGYLFDPASGRHYLFFAGSQAASASAFNGVVGACVSADPAQGWRLLPPLVSAEGVNNELERPHVVIHRGRYYLFWSTQRHVFDPAGIAGPTGLYGMVSDRLDGGWVPLNGSGLVFANPPAAPAQAYSWWVMPDLSVISFVDRWGIDAPAPGERRFGGCFAPWLRLWLDGDRAGLAG